MAGRGAVSAEGRLGGLLLAGAIVALAALGLATVGGGRSPASLAEGPCGAAAESPPAAPANVLAVRYPPRFGPLVERVNEALKASGRAVEVRGEQIVDQGALDASDGRGQAVVLGDADWLRAVGAGGTAGVLEFATDEVGIAYRADSNLAWSIREDNWDAVLLEEGTRFNRADPLSTRLGERTLTMLELAETAYGDWGLPERIGHAAPDGATAPSDASLMEALADGRLDYAFAYRSAAVAGGFEFLSLGPDVDLSSPERAETYARTKAKLVVEIASGRGVREIAGGLVVCAMASARGGADADAWREALLSEKGRAGVEVCGLHPLPSAYGAGSGAAAGAEGAAASSAPGAAPTDDEGERAPLN
jgi:ABC-type molybdate transport system substrate-binding protein